ncbi:hypothetical protein TELCIR_11624 [Teladorsagia circumcincta]|uniref:UTP23 sensor motif region domain-containing protein n=1 Tax=Teladorsagia circumcincta TaxID=45464 RepID=A0A2G9U8Q3_TELCI|nr:hypothetical protein TELCIR_11624 [Teladorsagia circumcincta]
MLAFRRPYRDCLVETSKAAVDDIHKSELENLKAIKAAVLGEQNVKKKKKKIKGANPLSCKKKKKAPDTVVPVKTGVRTASGKRKRSRRKASASVASSEVAR